MKKLLLLFVLTLNVLFLYAQNENSIKKERRIYLWDVTLSMKGPRYGGDRDIWDEVKNKLIKTIDDITDPDTEIILLPFQHKIIDNKTVIATSNGKNEIKTYIKAFDLPKLWCGDAATGHQAMNGEKGTTTMTKLYAPIRECVDKYVDNKKTNILIIMTDGLSDFQEDALSFANLLDNEWCDLSKANDIYAFYFMLTPQAIIKFKNTCITQVPPNSTGEITVFTLTPPLTINYNVKDDFGKPIEIKFVNNNAKKIKDGYMIHVESMDNPYFSVDQDCKFDPNRKSITIEPNILLNDKDKLRQFILQNGSDAKVELIYTPGKDMEEQNWLVKILSNIHTSVMFNIEKERTITLDWE